MAVPRTIRLWFLAIVIVALTEIPALPQVTALELSFETWIEEELWPEARNAGISRSVFDSAFADAVLDLDLPELVLPGADEGPPIDQSEFRAPAAYFDEGNLQTLTRIGREELRNWSSTLAAIEARYGVPREILLAIWARESAYGRASIPHHAITALATEAFLGRRPDKFRRELVAALQILQSGDITPEEMRSSWAGGLGMPQFLPSTFLQYAVDFDGDGHRDIWRSVPDSLASIANYLARNGWSADEGWGREVTVPQQVSCTLEGPDQGYPATAWQVFGVTEAMGDGTLFLLMPAGRFGPSFLVTGNFYVLKTYNQSDLYALFVGHLADRIAGAAAGFSGDWRPIDPLTHTEIQQMQRRLETAGYDVGGADGLIGYRTRISVGAAQGALGRPQTCFPDRAFIDALR